MKEAPFIGTRLAAAPAVIRRSLTEKAVKLFALAFLPGLFLLAGCGKADFSQEEDGPVPDPPPPEEEEMQDTLTVAQALYLAEYGTEEEQNEVINAVGIKGYIVGAIPGTSLSNARFSPPYNSNSNIIIADDKDELQPEKCMPVKLVKGTVFRDELNLEDNPANKGRAILVSGTVDYYFRTYGVTELDGYAWCDTGGGGSAPGGNIVEGPRFDFGSELVEGGR